MRIIYGLLLGSILFIAGFSIGKRSSDVWWQHHLADYIPTIRVLAPPAPFTSVAILLGQTINGQMDTGAKVGIHLPLVSKDVRWEIRDINFDMTDENHYVLHGICPPKPEGVQR